MAVDPVFARRLSKLAALKDKVDAPDDFFSQMVHRTVMLETKIERMSDKVRLFFYKHTVESFRRLRI